MTASQPFDAAVVGGGPAGSAAASVLAAFGRRVVLLEKDRFPPLKVCGEFLSASARGSLERLGVLGEVEADAEKIVRGSVNLPAGRAVCFRLPTPGLGISRFALDERLARRAGELGAETRFGARVVSVDARPGRAVRIRYVHESSEVDLEARGAIGAWGRWDALDRALGRGFERGPRRYFGWSRDFAGDTAGLAGEVRLYLFPGGYCGLSRVEGGAVNLAGVISESVRGRLAPGWEAVMAHARRSNAALDRDLAPLSAGPVGVIGTGPVFFTAKPPLEEGMLIAGDAAGVIDPFSGEGQAAALASGILAAEVLERGLSGTIAMEAVPGAYAAAWRERFGRRFTWSAAFRRLMLHPRLGTALAPLVGERLIGLALSRLGAGPGGETVRDEPHAG